ncbi:hypothetical protein ACOME3_000902 [Neoechinorhynchus agilis]
MSDYSLTVTIPVLDFTGQQCEVNVVNVINPSEFYVRRNDQSVAYKHFHNQLQESYKFENENPPKFQYYGFLSCVIYSQEDELWHRAIIGAANPNSDTVPAFLVDEGRTEIVPLSCIRPLKNNFSKMPRFASKCKLLGIKPLPNENKEENWSQDAVFRFNSAVNNGTLLGSFLKVNEVEGCFEVTLKDLEIQEYVSSNLLKSNLAKATNEQLSCFIPPELQMDITKELEKRDPFVNEDMTGETAECIISALSLLNTGYIQEYTKSERLNKLEKELEDTIGKDESADFDFQNGDYCLILHGTDQKPRRATIISGSKGEYQVFLLDYGIIDKVDKCLPIDIRFLAEPPFARKCRFRDLNEIRRSSRQIQNALIKINSLKGPLGHLKCKFLSFNHLSQTYDAELLVAGNDGDEKVSDILKREFGISSQPPWKTMVPKISQAGVSQSKVNGCYRGNIRQMEPKDAVNGN